ncbi:MAG: hypothetical protein ACXWC9_08610 [Pseudobdellovibrionaceae bacterium]
MKTVLMILTLVTGILASANTQFPAGYTRVDDAKMEDYKTAVRSALAQNPDVIKGCPDGWVYEATEYVVDILVNNISGQPLLMFNTYFDIEDAVMHRLVFTTDTTLKKITKVDAEEYRMGEVNQGDLSNPVIVQDYVLLGRKNCARPGRP